MSKRTTVDVSTHKNSIYNCLATELVCWLSAAVATSLVVVVAASSAPRNYQR